LETALKDFSDSRQPFPWMHSETLHGIGTGPKRKQRHHGKLYFMGEVSAMFWIGVAVGLLLAGSLHFLCSRIRKKPRMEIAF
jgi:hypothetical protein